MILPWPTRLAMSAATKRAKSGLFDRGPVVGPLPRAERLLYSAAKTEAPWSASHAKRLSTPDLEREYREAYADELVRLGIALPHRRSRTSGGGHTVRWRPPAAIRQAATDRAAAADKSLNEWITDVVAEALKKKTA